MRIILSIILMFFITTVFADVHVRGYTRRDGTYVAPHMRSDPDHNSYDNWSTKGNVNPYTGKAGTKAPGYDKGEVFGGQKPSQSLSGGQHSRVGGL